MTIYKEKEDSEETSSMASDPIYTSPSHAQAAPAAEAVSRSNSQDSTQNAPAAIVVPDTESANTPGSPETKKSSLLNDACRPPETKQQVLIDDQGQFLPGWWEQHDSLKELGKTLKKFKSPEALARSYAELEKHRSYPDPGDKERMKHIRNLLGVPEKKEDYRLTQPELAAGHESCWDTELAGRMAETAYEYAIPPIAMQALAETFTKEQEQYLDRQREEIETNSRDLQEKTLTELKNLWGPHCQVKIERAAHTLDRLCEECGLNAEAFGNNPALGSNPHLIRLLDHVTLLLSEPELKGHKTSDDSRAMEDVKRMEKDPAHPLHEAYMNYSHPNHEYANNLYDKIMLAGDK